MSNWKTQVAASAVVLTGIAGTEPSQAEPAAHRGSSDVGGIFIKIDGVQGDSLDAKHKGEIDVLAWSWGVAASNTSDAAGKTIRITKSIDKASARLAQAASRGEHLKTANLVVRRSGADQTEFLKIRLSELVISSVTIGASLQDGAKEEVVLAPRTVEFAYAPSGQAATTATFKY